MANKQTNTSGNQYKHKRSLGTSQSVLSGLRRVITSSYITRPPGPLFHHPYPGHICPHTSRHLAAHVDGRYSPPSDSACRWSVLSPPSDSACRMSVLSPPSGSACRWSVHSLRHLAAHVDGRYSLRHLTAHVDVDGWYTLTII